MKIIYCFILALALCCNLISAEAKDKIKYKHNLTSKKMEMLKAEYKKATCPEKKKLLHRKIEAEDIALQKKYDKANGVIRYSIYKPYNKY